MAEGGTLGGTNGFALGGDSGGTLGQAPYIAQTHFFDGIARERTELTGTFDG